MGKLARAQNPLSLRYRGRSRKEENTSQPHTRYVARSGRTLSPAPANQVLVLGKMLPAACTKNLHSLTSPPVCYQPLGGLYDFHTPGTRAARIVSFSLSNRNPFAGSVSF